LPPFHHLDFLFTKLLCFYLLWMSFLLLRTQMNALFDPDRFPSPSLLPITIGQLIIHFFFIKQSHPIHFMDYLLNSLPSQIILGFLLFSDLKILIYGLKTHIKG
jgi:hypothetical protein